MMDAFSTPYNTSRTLMLLASCGLLAIAAAIVGIDDNPPGILLAYLAAITFVLAFVHPWRTARRFMLLLLASVLGLVLFVILNIVLDSAAQNPATPLTLQNLIQSPTISSLNLIFAMLCPAAIIVSTVGSVAMYIRNRRQTT